MGRGDSSLEGLGSLGLEVQRRKFVRINGEMKSDGGYMTSNVKGKCGGVMKIGLDEAKWM